MIIQFNYSVPELSQRERHFDDYPPSAWDLLKVLGLGLPFALDLEMELPVHLEE